MPAGQGTYRGTVPSDHFHGLGASAAREMAHNPTFLNIAEEMRSGHRLQELLELWQQQQAYRDQFPEPAEPRTFQEGGPVSPFWAEEDLDRGPQAVRPADPQPLQRPDMFGLPNGFPDALREAVPLVRPFYPDKKGWWELPPTGRTYQEDGSVSEPDQLGFPRRRQLPGDGRRFVPRDQMAQALIQALGIG